MLPIKTGDRVRVGEATGIVQYANPDSIKVAVRLNDKKLYWFQKHEVEKIEQTLQDKMAEGSPKR